MPLIQKDFLTGRTYTTFELDPREFAAIGRVTTHWAYLEHGVYAVSYALCQTANIPLPDEVVNLSFKRRLRALFDIIHEIFSDETEKSRLLKIHSQIARVEHERHKLTHGLWAWSMEDPDKLTASSFRPKVEFEEPFDVEKMEELAVQIGEINFQLEYPEGLLSFFQDHIGEDGNVAYFGTSRTLHRAMTGKLPPDHPMMQKPETEG